MEVKALYKKFLKYKGVSAPKNKVQSKKPITVSSTGLWDKNKKKVIVPSNRITMKGPKGEQDFFKRPVLATGLQSGKQVLMQPGREYYFPEDNEVFEKRMQGGGLYAVGPYDEMMAPRQGNYLLPDINRPSYKDEFGGRRSEYKMGFNDNGKEVLIPTVVQGKQLSEDEAVDNYYRTGLHMGKYDTVQDAENASALRTAKYNMFEDPIRFKMSDYVPNMQDGGTVQTNMLQPIKKDEESLPVILDSLFSQFQKTKQEFGVEPEEEGATTELQKGGFKYTPPARTPFLRTSPAGNAGYSDNARVVTPFTGMDDATRARLDAQKAEEARRKRSGVISQGTPETSYQKAKRKSSFVEQEKERTGSASPISYALDLVNPATYAFAATDLVGNTGSAVKNAAQGNFQEAGSDLLGAGMNALYLLPAISPAKSVARFATTKTPLKNAWKLNPKAYQYNLPENTMWRGLGQEGMEDAINSGVFRSKQNVPVEYFPGSTLRLSKSFGTNPYFTPKFKTAASYGDNYLAEVSRDAANWKQRYARTDWSQVADRPIPVSEGRILQKDWLRGYKPIKNLNISNKYSIPQVNPFQPYENVTDAEMDDIYHAAVGSHYYPDPVQEAVTNWQEFKFVSPELSQAFNYPLRREMLLTRRLKTPLEVDESGFVKNITNKPIAFSAGPGNNLLGQNRVFFMAPEGTNVAPISRASSNVAMQRERELLFPSDTRFKLLHSRKNPETGFEDYIIGLDAPPTPKQTPQMQFGGYTDNTRVALPTRLFRKEKKFAPVSKQIEADNTRLAPQPITRAEDLPNFERIEQVEVKVKPSKNKNKEPKKTLKEIYEEATSKIKYDFGRPTARDNTAVYTVPPMSVEQKQKAKIAEDYRQAKEVRVPGRLLNVLPTPMASYIRGLAGENNAGVDFTESQKRAAAYAIAKAEERGSGAGEAGYTGSFDYGDYPAGYRDEKGGAHNPALSNLFNLPSLDGKTKKRLENVTEYWGSAMMQPTLGKANFKKYNDEEYLIHDKYNFDSYNPNSKSIIDRAEKFANELGVDTESNLTVPVTYVEEAKKQIANERQSGQETTPTKVTEPVVSKPKLQESYNQLQSVPKKAVPTTTTQPKKLSSSNQLSGERLKVQNYQKMLNERYGAGLDADGAWGPKTQAAYEKFILNKSMQMGGETSTEQNPESVGQVNIRAKDRGWFDNYIKRPLRKFGRSYAQRISDATGGSEWYKQANPFMNLAFESMNAPQYAATYAVTGKVQTPSEAMNIQNPYGAFAVDAVLDPTNLLGAGLAKQPLKAAGKNIVKSASNVTAPIVKYTDDVVQTSKLAGRPALPKYKDVYRAEHAAFNQAATPQDITGRWAVNDPKGASFYVQNLKDPNTGNVINAFSGEQAPVKIMKQRLPEYKYNQQFGEAMPEEARIMSMGRGVMTDAQLNETLGPGSAQRFKTNQFSNQDLAAMETAPFLFNPTEGILDPNMINNLRQGKNTLSSKTSLFDNQNQAADYLLKQSKSKQNVSSLNKYLPFNTFQMGGMSIPGVNGTVVASSPSLYKKYKKK